LFTFFVMRTYNNYAVVQMVIPYQKNQTLSTPSKLFLLLDRLELIRHNCSFPEKGLDT
jgi:protein-L-isoaspartate O-methyltransferase